MTKIIPTIQALKKKNSSEAQAFQKKHDVFWSWTLNLGLFAAILFSANLCFSISQPLAFIVSTIEIIALLAAFLLFYQLELGDIKKFRIKFRRNAELLRPVEAYLNAGIKLKELDNMDLSSEYDSPHIVEAITKYYTRNDYIKPYDEEQKTSLIELVKTQKRHHQRKKKESNEVLTTLNYIQLGLLVLFIVLALLNYYFACIGYANPTETSFKFQALANFLSLIIPLVLGAIEGYIYFKELRKNLKVSTYMRAYFKDRIRELSNARLNREEFLKIAHNIRQKMNEENINWCMSLDANANGKIG